MHENGPIAAAANVVLAAPDDLDRPLMLGCLQHVCRFRGHIGARRRAPAEAAAREHGFDGDLLRFQAQDGCGRDLIAGLQLRAEDQLNAIGRAADDAVVGFHRRMR